MNKFVIFMNKFLVFLLILNLSGVASHAGEGVPAVNVAASTSPKHANGAQGRDFVSQASSEKSLMAEDEIIPWVNQIESQISQRTDKRVLSSWIKDGGLFFQFEDQSFGLVVSPSLPRDYQLGIEPVNHPGAFVGVQDTSSKTASNEYGIIQEVTVPAVTHDADAWSGQPDFNSGSLTPLYAGLNADAFLQGSGWIFLRPDDYFVNGIITYADVTIYVEDSVGSWQVGTYAVADGASNFWSESSLTWNNNIHVI